ncbi:protein required for assembly of cytochrome c oxidase [Dipodascopsis tothii]|uniref:protein required for assembly of cytochrome c oxidase n=1 Tax=Dipodascopsis tothii TaxID=44089 RepID=UPI0034CF7B03
MPGSQNPLTNSCRDERIGLALCLQRSPCVLIERNTPKDCLMDDKLRETLPDACLARMRSFAACRRGILDMRKRFRGNGPLSKGLYDEQYEKMSKGDVDAREELRKSSRLY